MLKRRACATRPVANLRPTDQRETSRIASQFIYWPYSRHINHLPESTWQIYELAHCIAFVMTLCRNPDIVHIKMSVCSMTLNKLGLPTGKLRSATVETSDFGPS